MVTYENQRNFRTEVAGKGRGRHLMDLRRGKTGGREGVLSPGPGERGSAVFRLPKARSINPGDLAPKRSCGWWQ